MYKNRKNLFIGRSHHRGFDKHDSQFRARFALPLRIGSREYALITAARLPEHGQLPQPSAATQLEECSMP
jgi:hypothetical protein